MSGAAAVGLMMLAGASMAEARAQLLVLSAPERTGYYASVYEEVIDFQARYALAVDGRDEVLILTDASSYGRYVAKGVPKRLLVENARQADIWMRDFTTINPYEPVMFEYSAAAQGGSRRDARYVQGKFKRFAWWSLELDYSKAKYVLDGGNVVDNHEGRVVVTDRFLEDNELTYAEGKAVLREMLAADEVAIIPADDPNLAHADGMVMWAARDVLVANDYSTIDPKLRQTMLAELHAAFPTVDVVEVPVHFKNNSFDPKFSSATGINVNSVTTERYIYMPTFGLPGDAEVIRRVKEVASKEIVPVDAAQVARLGGSCRCLTWQTGGAVADHVRRMLTGRQ